MSPQPGRRIRGVLLDLSGTLHQGSRVIPGAPEAIQRLMQHTPQTNANNNTDPMNCASSFQIRILTNTSTVGAARLYQDLHDMGFTSLAQDQIYTSVLAMRDYLRTKQLTYCDEPLRPYCLLEDVSDFQGVVPLDPPHNAVVIGLAPSKFNYHSMNVAFQILQKYPHNLIAMHRGCYVKEHNGSCSLGPGAFLAALEAAVAASVSTDDTSIKTTYPTTTTTSPATTIVGKPSRAFYESVMWETIPPEEICMVGDDVYGDIQGAQMAGIGTTILVQTGKYRLGDEEKVAPTVVVPSIVEAVEYILHHAAFAADADRKE
jgi:HAD superfamily hydrolase (TIGR01458 family)